MFVANNIKLKKRNLHTAMLKNKKNFAVFLNFDPLEPSTLPFFMAYSESPEFSLSVWYLEIFL